jgi:transposase
MGGRKKRNWSDGEKREICQQTTVPGVSVAQVGRRYAVNSNLIFKWLKDPRFSPAEADSGDASVEAPFLEVTLASPGSGDLPVAIDASGPAPNDLLSANRVDISLSDGRRILIEGQTSLLAVVGLVEGLTV